MDTSRWLGTAVGNYKKLSEVSIPGTHDSAAYKINGIAWFFRDIAQTQDDTITTQLNKGIRYLDLRVYDDMTMHHGIASVGENLYYHLSEIKEFLENHPSEFVIVRIKNEEASSNRKLFKENIQKVFADVELGKWNYQARDYDKVLVGDIRGKILIIDDTNGLLTEDSYTYMKALNIQDVYEPSSADEKLIRATEHALSSKDVQNISINHLSYTLGNNSIRNLASVMNDKYENWLKENNQDLSQIGITICDFPTDSLIKEIIKVNL